jgi:hypothetical protein
LRKFWNNPKYNVLPVGILSIIVGSLYLPVPWYILGDETEAEIGVWGLSSILGGLFACIGSTFLSNKNTAVQKGLHIIAALGMILFIFAQVLPIVLWIMFWGTPITEGGSANPTTGGLHGLLPHILIVVLSIFALLSIVQTLFGKASKLRLNKNEIGRTGIVLLFLFLIWFGIDTYLSKTWIESTTPRPGEENVSIYTLVTATWEGERSNIGIRVRYADQPNHTIQGTTTGTQSSISFGPQGGFLPGKKVNVTVEAGRRSYSYSFTTTKK